MGYLALGAAVAGAGATYVAHEKGVKATEQQSALLAEQSRMQSDDVRLAQQYAMQAANEESSARALDASRELAFLDAAAAEYGGGASQSRMRGAVIGNLNAGLATITAQRNAEVLGTKRNADAQDLDNRTRLASIRANAPSRAGTILSLGAQGMSGYASYQSAIRKPPVK